MLTRPRQVSQNGPRQSGNIPFFSLFCRYLGSQLKSAYCFFPCTNETPNYNGTRSSHEATPTHCINLLALWYFAAEILGHLTAFKTLQKTSIWISKLICRTVCGIVPSSIASFQNKDYCLNPHLSPHYVHTLFSHH